jgi:hypothetical protein
MSARIIDLPRTTGGWGDLAVIEDLLARGEMVAGQLPTPSTWSPERKLAAASFTGALLTIRDYSHSRNRRRQREAQQDLEWLASEDVSWPYSFLCLCELFGLDPEWVRARVRGWIDNPRGHEGRRFSTHRHAA